MAGRDARAPSKKSPYSVLQVGISSHTDLQIKIRQLLAGSAGIPARMSAQRESRETFHLNVEVKRETVSALAHACGQGCPRSQRRAALFRFACRYEKDLTTETQGHSLKRNAQQAVPL